MSRALAFVFLSTFIVGFAAGFNVFLHTRDTLPSLPANDVSSGYDIIYDTYGACRATGCISYHVARDGSATRIVLRDGAQLERRDGTLTASAQQALVEALQATSFRASTLETCTPAAGESAVRLMVRIGETTYRYDSCLAPLPEPLGAFLENHTQWLRF
ncbi:hypothetical protein A3C89_00565 [Candidatus Kaiserbacteria bacterium RIFCSPHIGHO2_02_FULL_50_50]|uniref:Uncharacterized protein n=1 Tax=Candidatus Kaiserbacteria bacterium RIFCSPHIGHO2_02_FULL_50_50 TaxID=1798492 RepID=A0A1F6DFP3_9BACT|nr:MAG: hypothetical protein A3C89_00565 [Candidatus Kaiserbacteria bacterium RIFCSPHIGHO2_02_FULL_50_50]OGG88849.1 MAG: hypothetical protein A3G62_03005 [Candidatus Kaiserbacteria bacterium RIFCSPLOWO2_12_FULL_50_10]